MEKERIKRILELDKNFASNCVIALKDLKSRVENKLQDNQIINIKIARALADTTKEMWKREYCYTELEGVSLSIECISNTRIRFFLNNTKEYTSLNNGYGGAYCNNRSLDLKYVNGDKIGYDRYDNESTRLNKEKLIAFIDNEITECETEYTEYQNAINDIDSCLKEREKLDKAVGDYQHKHSWRVRQYMQKGTYNF